MRHPHRFLAAQLCQRPAYFGRVINGQEAEVSPQLSAAVVVLYDRLWNTRGPSWSTAKHAQARGWVLPAAWDEEAPDWDTWFAEGWSPGEPKPPSHFIDDPDAVPVDCDRMGIADRAAQAAELNELYRLHGSWTQVALYCRQSRDTLDSRIRRARLAGHVVGPPTEAYPALPELEHAQLEYTG